MYPQSRSGNKGVIFSPQRGSVNENDVIGGASQQKKKAIFLENDPHSYDAALRDPYQKESGYPNQNNANTAYMQEIKTLNFKDVNPYQRDQQKSIFLEGTTTQKPGFNNPLFDNQYNGQRNSNIGGTGQTPYQTSPQRYHRITYGIEGYDIGNLPQQNNTNVLGSHSAHDLRQSNTLDPQRIGSAIQFGSQPVIQGRAEPSYGIHKSQTNVGPNQGSPSIFDKNPTSSRGQRQGSPGPTGTQIQGSPGNLGSKSGVNPRSTVPGEKASPVTDKKAEIVKNMIAQRPYAILKNINEVVLAPKQENINFEGPERYSVTSDFYNALFKKAEFLLEQFKNEREVITNCQTAIKAFNTQKASTVKNLTALESEFMQGQGYDESVKSGSQLKKIENLAAEIDNCKKLAQDSEKLEDFYKRGIITRATRKNIPDFEAEVNSISDRIVKESNALDENLRLLREFRKENSNSTRFEQKANQVLADLNWHKDIYLESWNRIHNVFNNLSDHFGQQAPELAQMAKKYNEVFNLGDYQSEIRTMELYQQRIAQIKTALGEHATFLGSIYQTIDNTSPFIQIRKRDDYKKVIPERKKALENLKKEIKALKYAIKSYRDPSNAKSLVSQRIRHKISDSLAEDIKQANYKADNVLLLCDVLVEVEKEELLFKELYQSNLPRCQTKLVEKAEKFHAEAGKGKTENIAKTVDTYCQGFNQIISEYIQIKTRVTNHSGNPEVQSVLGPILRDFIKKLDAQLKICTNWKDKIFKMRYLGSKIETQIDELKVEEFVTSYNQFMTELAKNYKKIETFIKDQETREKLLSLCRKKNERLKDLANKQSHEKTDDKIKKSAQSLIIIDENLSLLDECTTAATKVKSTVEFLLNCTASDFEQGNLRSHLKDERDVLAQTARLAYTLESKNTKDYDIIREILNWYGPQFSTLCEIYDLILKFFYNKEGISVFNDPNLHRSDLSNNFKSFYYNMEEHNKVLLEEYVKSQYSKCIGNWQRLVDQKLTSSQY